MRRLSLAALLVAAAACGPYDRWVPLEVDWTFGGKSCADAGVTSIQIAIEGELLSPDKFTCQEASQGAALGDFLVGPYTVTVTGFDSAGNVVYQSTQVVQVRGIGKNVIAFDAAPTTGTATLHWTFGGKGCDAAGVATVRVSVDNQVITDAHNNPDLPCKGPTFEGTTIGPLSPGAHTFALAAHASGADYALSNLGVSVVAGQDTAAAADLQKAAPTTASAEVRWTFQPGSKSCVDAGADHLYVVFDPLADGSGGTVVADTACAGLGGAPVTEIQIVDVPDGNHSFAVRATKANQLVDYTHHPVATLFTAPFTTTVDVTLEALP
jgi:hypothetical protein